MIDSRSGRFRKASVNRSPIFLYHSWTARSWPRSERPRVELRVAAIEERRHGLRRLQDGGDHLRLVRTNLLVAREHDEPVRRRHLVRLETLHRRLDRLHHVLSSARALDVRRLRVLGPQVVRHVEDRTLGRDIDRDELRPPSRRLIDFLQGTAELVPVHRGHFGHSLVPHTLIYPSLPFSSKLESPWRKSSSRSAVPSSCPGRTMPGGSAPSRVSFAMCRPESSCSS